MAQVRGTVLLYLKCFLPHSLPQEGAQPHPPGVAPCSPSHPAPCPALLGQPEFPAAACPTLLSLDQLRFLSVLSPLKPALFPSLAAFKLFILYLWFGALRKNPNLVPLSLC